MLESLIGVLVALAILAVVYVVLKWILGQFTLPEPIITIVNIVVSVVAIIIVLRFLLTLI